MKKTRLAMTAEPDEPDERTEDNERARLVRLCRTLTRDPDAAEDLAQETLLVAQERAATLRHQTRRWAWLAATARHLSVDWVRHRVRERRHLAAPTGLPAVASAEEPLAAGGEIAIPGPDYDLSVELERSELAVLLDRAMALLPPETRLVLIERLVEDVPQAQVALRHGLSEGAVEARLHRGKLALRRILATDLREEAAPYGLADPEGADGWQTTRIWCSWCGQRRLLGRFYGPGRELQLECRDCLGVPGGARLPRSRLYDSGRPELFQGIKGFKAALNRQLDDLQVALSRWAAGRRPTARCVRCGTRAVRNVQWEPEICTYVSTSTCPVCRWVFGHTSTRAVLKAHPAGRRFWREHPRVRAVPDQGIEVNGRPAIVTRLVSVTDTAELAMVLDAETFAVLDVDGAPPAAPPPTAPRAA